MKEMVRKRFSLLIFGLMFVALLWMPNLSAKAGEIPMIKTVNYTEYCLSPSMNAVEIEVTNSKPDSVITYQWYVTTKDMDSSWGEDGWFAIDDEYSWAWCYDTSRLLYYVGYATYKGDQSDDNTLRLGCKVTMDGESAWSDVYKIRSVESAYIKEVNVVGKYKTAKPVLGDTLNYELKTSDSSTKYGIASGDGACWYRWDDSADKWVLKDKDHVVEKGTYRLELHLKTNDQYKFRANDGAEPKTVFYVQGEEVKNSSISWFGNSCTVIAEYDVSSDGVANVIKLATKTNVYGYKVGVIPDTTLSSGENVQVLNVEDYMVRVKYRQSKYGWISASDLISGLPKDYHWYTTLYSNVKVRKGPGDDTSVAKSLKKGKKVYAIGKVLGWVLIAEDENSKSMGWVKETEVDIVPTGELAKYVMSPRRAIIEGTGFNTVNVRKEASTSSDRIGGLKLGDAVTVTGLKKVDGVNWLIINYNYEFGYIMDKYTNLYSEDDVLNSIAAAVSIGDMKIMCMSPTDILNVTDEDFSQSERGIVTCTVLPGEGYALPDDPADFKFEFGKYSGYAILKATAIQSGSAKDGIKVILADTSIYKMKKPVITSAKNKASRKIVLKWKKDSEAQGYYIKYKTGKKSKTVKVTSYKTVTKTLKKLKKGKTYKVYIRSYTKLDGKKIYSSWSKGKKIKIKR